ncbi:hypothetical protein [Hirschia maritima]|uniref:hypothetical protein n=1 Tax=Hirschia maritima TaxID=1121961 RepID=UPI00035DC25D|nr:hypothetical protein [Hirschia maritima]
MKQRRIYLEHIQFGSLFKLFFSAMMCCTFLFACLLATVALISPDKISIQGNRAETSWEALMVVPWALLVGALNAVISSLAGAFLFRMVGKFVHFGELNYDEHASKALTENEEINPRTENRSTHSAYWKQNILPDGAKQET